MPRPVIPQEILDLIIDHLHDERTTLNVCCLVSKAWLPRTRKHIFIEVKFLPFGRHIPQWKRSFPDPATSPAHNIRTLSIRNPKLITTENADTLLTFCGVTHLNVDTDLREDRLVSLALFHGFSPVVRSLHLTTTLLRNSEIFDLICSFPLLEDLTLVSRLHRTGYDAWNHPSTSPRFTGSLELHPNSAEGIGPTAYHLLNLPNGLHFSGITVPWHSDSDVKATMDLVSTCSDTLETLDIANRLSSMFSTTHSSGWDLMFKFRRVLVVDSRPFQGGKAPGRSISVQEPGRTMDHQGPSHRKTWKPSTGLVAYV